MGDDVGDSDRYRIAVTEGEGWYVSTMFRP